MNEKALKTLEFYKITSQLAEYASCPSGREMCLSLVPSTDFEEVVSSQKETSDAASRVRMKGGISFTGDRKSVV